MDPGRSDENHEKKWIKSIALCKKNVNTRSPAVNPAPHGYPGPLPSSPQASSLFKCPQRPLLFWISPAPHQQVTPQAHSPISVSSQLIRQTVSRWLPSAFQVRAVVWAPHPGNRKKTLSSTVSSSKPKVLIAFSRPFLGFWPPFVTYVAINSQNQKLYPISFIFCHFVKHLLRTACVIYSRESWL